MAETKPETKTLVLECPDCGHFRGFSYSGYFTMAGGKEAHVRSCVECGFKRHFTPEGIPFGKIRKRKARQHVPNSKKLNRKVLQSVPKITPQKRREGFPSRTSGLNTHDTVPKITPKKGLEGFLSQTRTLVAEKKDSHSNYSVNNFLRTWDIKSSMLVKVGTGGST